MSYGYKRKRKRYDNTKYRTLSSGTKLMIITNDITTKVGILMTNAVNHDRDVILEYKSGEYIMRLKWGKYSIGFIYIDKNDNITKYTLCFDDLQSFFSDVNINSLIGILNYYIGKKLKKD